MRRGSDLGLAFERPAGRPPVVPAGSQASFHYLKGALESALEALRYTGLVFLPARNASYEEGSALEVAFKGEKIGVLGRVRDEVLRKYGATGPPSRPKSPWNSCWSGSPGRSLTNRPPRFRLSSATCRFRRPGRRLPGHQNRRSSGRPFLTWSRLTSTTGTTGRTILPPDLAFPAVRLPPSAGDSPGRGSGQVREEDHQGAENVFFHRIAQRRRGLSNEIDRLKILEGKISGVIEHVHRLTAENDKLRQAVKDLKSERKDGEELAGRSPSLTATSKDTKMKGKK